MITEYRIVDHAREEMRRRQIRDEQVAEVLANPEQMLAVWAGRVAYQARIEMGDPAKVYLLRVFVDVDRTPPEVVTVYRTSKLKKYGGSTL